MKRKTFLRGLADRLFAAAVKRDTLARAGRCTVESLEGRTLLAVTTETFTGGTGPFTTSFLSYDNVLNPRGVLDGSETLQLTSGDSFQVIRFTLRHNGGSGNVTRVRIIGYAADNAKIYDNPFNTPPNTTVTIDVNTKVARLEFQPITVTGTGQQFVGQGVLRIRLDDFTYDPEVAGNSPPQLTGMGAGHLGSFRENGQLSIFSNPGVGIQASVQDADDDTVTVEVQADDPARGLLIGLDQDSDGKYFTPVPGQPNLLRLVGTPAEATRAIRDTYLYFANVDDVTDTGRDYTTTFTVRISDGHNPVVTSTVQGVLHGVNEAPTITSSANPASELLDQFTYDRDTNTPFSTVTVDDPDSKPVLLMDDVLPDVLHVDIGFPDANGALVGAGWGKTGVSAGVATWRFNGNHAQATAAVRAVRFNPTDQFTPGALMTTHFTIKVTDSGDPFDHDPVRGAPLSFTFASPVSVLAKTNTSPVLGGGPINRGAIVEGENSPSITVASLVSSPNAMADVDTDQRKGVAVVAATGLWQYSTDGINWTHFGAVSPAAALVLSDTTQVRFMGGDTNGQVSFTYKAWDRSSWLNNVGGTASSAAARVLVDASQFSAPPQNVSPFSLSSVANNQPVTPINDAPNVVNGTMATLAPVAEDDVNPAGETVSAVFAGVFSDADDDQAAFGGSYANQFAGVAVVGNGQTPTSGTWQYTTPGAADWSNVGTAVSNAAALLLAPDAKIRFVPAANFNGPSPGLLVRLVEDSSGPLASGATADVSVNGDPTRYSAATVTAQLTVTPVNDAPTVAGGPGGVTLAPVAEDIANPPGASIANLIAFRFSDSTDQVAGGSQANTLAGVAVTANGAAAAQGKWQYNAAGAWLDLPAATPSAAVALGREARIRFLPAANFNGAAPVLTVRLVDDSAGVLVTGDVINAAANGGTTAISAASLTLGQTITEVNDAPTATADSLSSIAEDSGPRVIPFTALLGNDSVGPADEAAQSLVVKSVGGAIGGSVRVFGTSVIFTPARDYNGPAGFTYTVEDNGTTNGSPGPLTSAAATVSFAVTAVSDAPVVASLSATPGEVTAPDPFVLAAVGVGDPDGASDVARVNFYRESNGAPGLQTGPSGDTLLGGDHDPAGGYAVIVNTHILAPGTYTYYATAVDAVGAVSNVASTTQSVLPPPGPRVQAVYINSTLWSPAFHSYLAQNELGGARGFRIPAGSGQLTMRPWTNLNQIQIVFDQDVDISQDDLRVHGVNVASYPFESFSYDAQAYTARWTLASGVNGIAIVADKLLLDLNGDAGGVTGTGARALAALDGEWTDNASNFPSGNGMAGGDFRFRINVLAGDAGRNGTVLADDFAAVKKRFFKAVSSPASGTDADYSPFHDLDGSGGILANDSAEVKRRFFAALPAGNPVLPAGATAGAGGAPFATEPVRLADELLV